jgi:MFS family permease
LQASLTDWFTLGVLGAMLGVLAMTAGVAGSAANALGAALYDAQLRAGERACVGGRCFRGAFGAAAVVALCGLAAALALAPATRQTDGSDAGGAEVAEAEGKLGRGGGDGGCCCPSDEPNDSELASLVD